MDNNNKIILSLSAIVILSIVLNFNNTSEVSMVKTKKEVESMRNQKDELFELADKTMEELDTEREQRLREIKILDSTLKANDSKIKNSFLVLQKNKQSSDSLQKLISKYENQKDYLESQLKVSNVKLMESEEMFLKTNEELVSTCKERDDYKIKFDSIYNIGKDIIYRDTIYIEESVTSEKPKRKKNKN
jgi:hypothetical protein